MSSPIFCAVALVVLAVVLVGVHAAAWYELFWRWISSLRNSLLRRKYRFSLIILVGFGSLAWALAMVLHALYILTCAGSMDLGGLDFFSFEAFEWLNVAGVVLVLTSKNVLLLFHWQLRFTLGTEMSVRVYRSRVMATCIVTWIVVYSVVLLVIAGLSIEPMNWQGCGESQNADFVIVLALVSLACFLIHGGIAIATTCVSRRVQAQRIPVQLLLQEFQVVGSLCIASFGLEFIFVLLNFLKLLTNASVFCGVQVLNRAFVDVVPLILIARVLLRGSRMGAMRDPLQEERGGLRLLESTGETQRPPQQ